MVVSFDVRNGQIRFGDREAGEDETLGECDRLHRVLLFLLLGVFGEDGHGGFLVNSVGRRRGGGGLAQGTVPASARRPENVFAAAVDDGAADRQDHAHRDGHQERENGPKVRSHHVLSLLKERYGRHLVFGLFAHLVVVVGPGLALRVVDAPGFEGVLQECEGAGALPGVVLNVQTLELRQVRVEQLEQMRRMLDAVSGHVQVVQTLWQVLRHVAEATVGDVQGLERHAVG